jgi:hypothetical protein
LNQIRRRALAVQVARAVAYVDRHFLKIVLALLVVFGGRSMLVALRRWRELTGYEPEWIAQALASGHGYSFDGQRRWLFDYELGGAPDQYFATAWAEPVFTVLYAAIMVLSGDWSRLVIVLLLITCSLGAAALAAMAARRLAGPLAGVLALLVLLATIRADVVSISSPALAGLWVALLLWLLVAQAERLSLRTSVILGALLGISVLTWSSTMVFGPVVVVLLFWFAPAPRAALKMSAATILTATLLVTPWTVRSYLVFGEFVPVRTGLGHLAHIGTIGLSKTFAPERSVTPVPAPFPSSGPFAAVASQVGEDSAREAHRRLLQVWQWEEMAAQLGPGVEVLNEAQKDQWLIGEAKDFVIANPLLTAQLGVAKLWSFLRLGWPRGSPIGAVLTVFGLAMCSVLAFREQRLLIPLTMALALYGSIRHHHALVLSLPISDRAGDCCAHWLVLGACRADRAGMAWCAPVCTRRVSQQLSPGEQTPLCIRMTPNEGPTASEVRPRAYGANLSRRSAGAHPEVRSWARFGYSELGLSMTDLRRCSDAAVLRAEFVGTG